MIIDLHCHEKTFSPCSHVSLTNMVEEAKKKGLDAFCITDHDSLGLREAAHSYSEVCGYPIFVGTELYTFEGDVVVFGLQEAPVARMHLFELLDLVRDIHGFCFSAHPYRSNLRGLQDHIFDLKSYADVAGIEIVNGRTDHAANLKAEQICRELGLFQVGGSDAHEADEVGNCATWLPGGIQTEYDLIQALRSGKSKAVVYENGFFRTAAAF